MRGTPGTRYHVRHYAGIIPAYAGNTLQQTVADDLQADHPRVCGEHRWSSRRHSTHPGSSPRMRGTLFDERFRADGGGIIPAYAGNTYNYKKIRTRRRDHPRVCGEHQSQIGAHLRTLGIIPAYAGNTLAVLRYHIRHWDHPRVCGEHPLLATPKHVRQGSSPRMRGTLGLSVSCRVLRGIIPAYAGNTARSCRA